MSQGPSPPALPAKNIHSSQSSLPHKSSFSSPMSPNFTSQSQTHLNPCSNSGMNGSMGMGRASSITSQPPMHLNYPPKPQQLLNSLQQPSPYPKSNGIGQPSTDMQFSNPNQNRVNSNGYPNNHSSQISNFMGNRTPSQAHSTMFQQNMFGNAGNVVPSHHSMQQSQIRPNHEQFQGPPDRLLSQHVSTVKGVDLV